VRVATYEVTVEADDERVETYPVTVDGGLIVLHLDEGRGAQ
jgi:nitrite reductase/ring-hydroxylating ferredoxin subunit